MAMPHPVQSSLCCCCCCDPDSDIHRGPAILEEGGSQPSEAADLLELCSVHVDLCCTIADDHDFALVNAGLHSMCVLTVCRSVGKVLQFCIGICYYFDVICKALVRVFVVLSPHCLRRHAPKLAANSSLCMHSGEQKTSLT